MKKSSRRKKIAKRIIFLILLFTLSFPLIPLFCIATVLALIYIPFEKLIFNKKYQDTYYPLCTLFKSSKYIKH